MTVLDSVPKRERTLLSKSDPPELCELMLATLTHDHFSDPDWIFERKLDGERILAFCMDGKCRLMTRNRSDVTRTYPEISEALGKAVPDACILDGEIVAFEGKVTSFAKLQQRMHAKDPDDAHRRRIPVFYYVFDIIFFGQSRLERLPLRTRKVVLKTEVAFDDPLRFTTHRNSDGEAFLAEACEKGWEGLIAKRAAGAYQHKRTRDWLKFKCSRGQELVIGGFTEPHGERHGFGAVLVGYYENGKLRYAGKVGTGFDDETLTRLRKRFDDLIIEASPFVDGIGKHKASQVTWLSPKLVGEFGFTEWTNNGRLRHPRYLGLRRDKKPADVVRES